MPLARRPAGAGAGLLEGRGEGGRYRGPDRAATIGPTTISAATVFADELSHLGEVVSVGEPTGSDRSRWSDDALFELAVERRAATLNDHRA